MTVIDSLVVMLGLESKDLETKSPAAVKKLNDLEKAGDKTEKSVKKISTTSKETARSVEGLSRTVTSFLALIGGTVAIKAFIQDFIETNAQLDRFSKNIGLSVSTISAWSNATERLGGSAQGLQGTLDMLSKSQTQLMLTGESSLIPYMAALGISLADVSGKARPVTDILLELSDRFSHMDRTTANNMGRMMGLDQGTLNLLLQGRKELELEIRRQKEQTAVTKAQAEEASKLQRRIVDIKQTFMAFGRTLLMDAAPALEKLLGMLQTFANWIQQNGEAVGDFLKVIAVGVGAIALASAPMNLTVLAVLALGAAIALLWQDYQTWKRGGDSLIDWGKWEPAITAAEKGVRALADAVGWLHDKLNELIKLDYTGFKILRDFAAGGVPAVVGGFMTGQYSEENADKWANSDSIASALGIRGKNAGSPQMAKYMLDFFKSQGWSSAQAAGIAANLLTESGGRANAVGDKGAAYGIAQWHKDRQAAFKKWSGKDIQGSSLQEQLAFVQYELTQGNEQTAGRALKGADLAAQAGAIISMLYERPKNSSEAATRGNYAQSLVMGIPGAASVAAGAPQAGGSPATVVDRSVSTKIDHVEIHTQATDAAGIGKDLENHAWDYLFASQANYGLVP